MHRPATGGGFGSATLRRHAQMGAKALTVRGMRSPTSENAVWAKFGISPALWDRILG